MNFMIIMSYIEEVMDVQYGVKKVTSEIKKNETSYVEQYHLNKKFNVTKYSASTFMNGMERSSKTLVFNNDENGNPLSAKMIESNGMTERSTTIFKSQYGYSEDDKLLLLSVRYNNNSTMRARYRYDHGRLVSICKDGRNDDEYGYRTEEHISMNMVYNRNNQIKNIIIMDNNELSGYLINIMWDNKYQLPHTFNIIPVGKNFEFLGKFPTSINFEKIDYGNSRDDKVVRMVTRYKYEGCIITAEYLKRRNNEANKRKNHRRAS